MTREQAMLKLDVDRKRPPSTRRMRWLLGRGGYQMRALVVRRSPSGSGWHVWVEVSPRPKSPAEVVALQAILGSDPAREAVTLYRGLKMRSTPVFARDWWNVLYQPGMRKTRHLLPREGGESDS